jgi:hypothetical protein
MGSVGCIFDDKYVVKLQWVGEQRIYGGQLVMEPYPMLTAARLFTWRDGKLFRPFIGLGFSLKEAQRCHFNGDLNCNRQLPLPFAFYASVGMRWGDDIVLTLGHDSNSSLDRGDEAKNLGLDSAQLEMVLWRW